MGSKLSLISDDYGRAGRFGPVHVVVAPEHAPPFPIDALAVEEDTHLLLSSVWIIAPTGSETELMWALRSEFAGK